MKMLMRKSELKRTAFKVKAPAAEPKVKMRRCAVKTCRTLFAPRSITHKCCSPACAEQHVLVEKARRDRKDRQEGLAKLKRRADYLREAQAAFNAVIRLRDKLAGHACISSGKLLDWSGNNVDAGHYRSVGSAQHLRFNEDNVHAQSKQENRYASGNAVDYRVGLIARIGLARVEALEADQTPRKYTIPELQELKAHYKEKLRQLQGAENV